MNTPKKKIAKETQADGRTLDIAVFQQWVKTVPRDQLERHLIDAVWKGVIEGTELYRFFTLETGYGTRMIHRPASEVMKMCTAAGCTWFGSVRPKSWKCPECKGKVKHMFESDTIPDRRKRRR